jgi:hypothetical protein
MYHLIIIFIHALMHHVSISDHKKIYIMMLRERQQIKRKKKQRKNNKLDNVSFTELSFLLDNVSFTDLSFLYDLQ